MSGPLVLSLFPGIGLLDMAFELEGFCVVRGPDPLWGGDIRDFNPPAGRFEGVIGGPPCQVFSRLRFVNPKAGQRHGNLIPEFERVAAEARPDWFLMENVDGAPLPEVEGYRVHAQLLRDDWVGGATSRLRRFSFGTPDGRRLDIEQLALHRSDPETAAYAAGGGAAVPVALGGSGKRKSSLEAPDRMRRLGYKTAHVVGEHLRKQGLPADFLDDCPLTVQGKVKVLGNGVPMHMGRAAARAVRQAMGYTMEAA